MVSNRKSFPEWIVVNFKKRQKRATDAERQARSRQRKRAPSHFSHATVTGRSHNVTKNVTNPVTQQSHTVTDDVTFRDTEVDIDKELREEKEEESEPASLINYKIGAGGLYFLEIFGEDLENISEKTRERIARVINRSNEDRFVAMADWCKSKGVDDLEGALTRIESGIDKWVSYDNNNQEEQIGEYY